MYMVNLLYCREKWWQYPLAKDIDQRGGDSGNHVERLKVDNRCVSLVIVEARDLGIPNPHGINDMCTRWCIHQLRNLPLPQNIPLCLHSWLPKVRMSHHFPVIAWELGSMVRSSTSLSPTGSDQHWSALSSSAQNWSVLIRMSTIRMDQNWSASWLLISTEQFWAVLIRTAQF